ncbi:FtsX-like permease family protein, partial [bacterium]|nr:FtsX-like permease family protein [bacterium]
ILAELGLPMLNTLAGKSLNINLLHDAVLLGGIAVLVLTMGVAAGFYPALVMSGFRPLQVLKGSYSRSRHGTVLRRALVVFQFSLAVAIIAGTMIVQSQIQYILHRDMGYDRSHVLLLDFNGQHLGQGQAAFRERLASIPEVVRIGGATSVPGRGFGRNSIRPEGVPDEDIWIWSVMNVDYDLLPALGIEIAQGRNFSREYGADSTGSVLINQTAADLLGWEEPVGKRIYYGDSDSVGVEVIGVTEDFNFASVHEKIEPILVSFANKGTSTLSIRLEEGHIPAAMEKIETAWNEVYEGYPFEYAFMDEEFEEQYRADLTFGTLSAWFSGLAIVVAGLGLLGLASYSTEQRRKEIGVRKVLGASMGSITWMLIVDFLRWVAIANVIALPVAWYVGRMWLQGFEYRTSITAAPFLQALLVSLAIAVLTVLWQSLRAAQSNPVDSLKYE